MKAIQVSEVGGPEVLSLQEIPDPSCGPDEVVIRIEYAGVNFIDTYHRAGLYPLETPFVPGIEAAGVVEQTGEAVDHVSGGDRVIFCLSRGGYAEKAVVEGWKVVKIPSDVDSPSAVTAMCQGMTAHYLTTDCYRVEEGQTALVHAAAGGVGLLLVQMITLAGARVIGTTSTEEKAELARDAGAAEVVLYTEQDFEEEVKRMTGGEGVEVVYESVGKSTFEKSLNCLKKRGYLVLFGQSSGPVDPIDPQILNQKGSLFLTRPTLFDYAGTSEEFKRRAGAVLRMIAEDEIEVIIGKEMPLEEAAEAHRLLEGRQTVGKVLLVP